MKKNIIITIMTVVFNYAIGQQNETKTFTLSVKGNCEQCKERIENAADIKGVKLCNWNADKQMATITYKPEKVNPEQIEKAIAASGHDVGNTKGNQAKYNKLPSCCKYRERKCEEKGK